MTLVDTVTTFLAPLVPLILGYILLHYLPVITSRKVVLSEIDEVSATFTKFARELKKADTKNWKTFTLSMVSLIIGYTFFFLATYYPIDLGIYEVFGLVLIVEAYVLLITVVMRSKTIDPILTKILKNGANILFVIMAAVSLVLFMREYQNYLTTTMISVTSSLFGFVLIYGVLLLVAFYFTRLETASDVENFIFQKKYSGKIKVEIITKKMTIVGKVVGIGDFLDVRNNRKTQIIKWHDIVEVAVFN